VEASTPYKAIMITEQSLQILSEPTKKAEKKRLSISVHLTIGNLWRKLSNRLKISSPILIRGKE